MPILVAAVLTMSAAQLLDLATFVTMVRTNGPASEANPLVGFLFDAYGFPLVAIAKVVLLTVATAVATILAVGLDRQRLARAVVAVGILVGIVGGFSNVVAVGAVDTAIEHVGLGGP